MCMHLGPIPKKYIEKRLKLSKIFILGIYFGTNREVKLFMKH